MKLIKKITALFLTAAGLACAASAQAQTSNTELVTGTDPAGWASVDTLGVQNGFILVKFVVNGTVQPTGNIPGLSSSCLYSTFYIDITQPHARAMHQQLMLAKSTNKRFSRVSYQQATANATCTIWLLEQRE
jgi:hypothetical protein